MLYFILSVIIFYLCNFVGSLLVFLWDHAIFFDSKLYKYVMSFLSYMSGSYAGTIRLRLYLWTSDSDRLMLGCEPRITGTLKTMLEWRVGLL